MEYEGSQKVVAELIRKTLFKVLGGGIPENTLAALVKDIDAVYDKIK